VIRHIVLFNFKAGTTQADEDETLRRYRAMKDVPSIKSIELCTPVRTHSRHALATFKYAYAAVMTFDDVAGFEAYREHPLHLEFDEGWVKRFLDEETVWSCQFAVEPVG
jgi:hypothetical protein